MAAEAALEVAVVVFPEEDEAVSNAVARSAEAAAAASDPFKEVVDSEGFLAIKW